jgi:hypothetical protein
MLALFSIKPVFLVLQILHLPYFSVSCRYSSQSAVFTITSVWFLAMSYIVSCYFSLLRVANLWVQSDVKTDLCLISGPSDYIIFCSFSDCIWNMADVVSLHFVSRRVDQYQGDLEELFLCLVLLLQISFVFPFTCRLPPPNICTSCSCTCMGSFIQNAWDWRGFLSVGFFHNLEHHAYSSFQPI